MTRNALYTLQTKANRAALETRKPPYYQTLDPGLSLGYRKTGNGKATWTVRKLAADGISYTKATLAFADDDRLIETVSAGDVEALTKKITDTPSLLRKLNKEILSFRSASILAREWGKQGKSKIKTGTSFRVSDAIANYAAHRADAGATKRLLDKEASVFNKHIPPELQKMLVMDLDSKILTSWMRKLPGAVANQNRIIGMLRAALNLALTHKEVGATTWESLKTKKIEEQNNAGTVLTPIEVSDFIKGAPNKATANLLEGCALSGFRVGEIIALSVGGFKDGKIYVPKNKTKARNVAVSSAFGDLIKKLSAGRGAKEPIFLSPSGERWRDGEQYKQTKLAAAAAGLPSNVSVYDLRHTYITRSIQAGIAPIIVGRVCGTSLKMIEENYLNTQDKETRRLLDSLPSQINVEVTA